MFLLVLAISALSHHLNFISKKTKECLRSKNRDKQNKLFKEIKHPYIKPVKMTSSSAVFHDKLRNQIIKRIVKKRKSSRKEEKYSKLFDHPNILKTYDVKWEQSPGNYKTFYLVSEFLNQPISSKLINGREEIIQKICKDVLLGLAYLHEKDFAHLDLKIGNVMGNLDKRGNLTVKIIDFGFMRKISGDETLDMGYKYYGTYPYSPPEVYFHSIYSKKSDIWSLGCLIGFLIDDIDQFYYDDGERNYDVYEMFLRGEHELNLERAGTKLRNFVMRCLAIDPRKRPSARELLQDEFITTKIK